MASTDTKDEQGRRPVRNAPARPTASANPPAAELASTVHDAAGHEPWDEADADALADAYEQSGHPIVDAAEWSRSQWLDPALPPARRKPPVDQEWLDARLAELARHFEATLAAMKPDAALHDLATQVEDSEQRLTTALTSSADSSAQTVVQTVTRSAKSLTQSLDKSTQTISQTLDKSTQALHQNVDKSIQTLTQAVEKSTQSLTQSVSQSVQTVSTGIPKQVTDAMVGVLSSATMTGVLDRAVNKAVGNTMNSGVTSAMTGAVTTAVASAVGGVVTTALTGAVTGRMDAVTNAVTNAVNATIPSAVGSAVDSRMDLVTAAVANAVNNAVPQAVASAIDGRMHTLTTHIGDTLADGMQNAVGGDMSDRVAQAVQATLAETVASEVQQAVAGSVGDAVDQAVARALPAALAEVATKADVDGLYGLQNQLADIMERCERTDERVARIDDLEHHIAELSDRLTDERLQALAAGGDGASHHQKHGARFDALETQLADLSDRLSDERLVSLAAGGAGSDERLASLESHLLDLSDRLSDDRLQSFAGGNRLAELEHQIAELADRLSEERLAALAGAGGAARVPDEDIEHAARTAAEYVAQDMLARIPSQAGADSQQMADVRALLEAIVTEQRQGDESTSTMLDTLQQAMLAVLDRVDALESSTARMTDSVTSARARAANESQADEHFESAPAERTSASAVADAARGGRGLRFEPQAAAEPEPIEPALPEPKRNLANDTGRTPRRAADNPVSDRLPMRAPSASRPAEPAPAKDDYLSAARRIMGTSGAGRDGDSEAATPRPSAAPEGRTPPRARTLASDAATGTPPPPRGKADRRALVAIIAILALGAGYQLLSRPGTDSASRQAALDRPAVTVTVADTPTTTVVLANTGDAATTSGDVVEGTVPVVNGTPQGIVLGGRDTPLTPAQVMALRAREEQARLSSQLGASAFKVSTGASHLPMGVTPSAIAPTETPQRAQPRVSSGTNRAAQPATTSSIARTPELELPPATVGPLSMRRAAATGDASAQFEVATRLAEGRGTQQDMQGAVQWYTRAAEQGFAPAEFRLATIYERGLSVTTDIARAKELYGRAAERGHVKAMHNLAVLHANKTDISEPDYAAALPWFQRAAAHGLADSQFNLAVLLESGLGAPRDPVRAYKWQALAARAGDAQAAKRRDVIAPQLDAKERAQVDAEVAAWRALPSERIVNDARAAGDLWRSRANGAA